jgi:hypothetical protein
MKKSKVIENVFDCFDLIYGQMKFEFRRIASIWHVYLNGEEITKGQYRNDLIEEIEIDYKDKLC